MFNLFVLYFAAALLFFLKSFSQYRFQKKRLGEPILLLKKEQTKPRFLRSLALFTVSIVIAVYYILQYWESVKGFELIFIVVIGVLSGSLLLPVVLSGAPLGIYENGVVTLTGVKRFEKIGTFEITPIRQKQISTVCLFPPRKWLGKVSYFYIENGQKKKVNRLLQTNIT